MTRNNNSNSGSYIQILGGGLAGWSAAGILATELGGAMDVHLSCDAEESTRPSNLSGITIDGESILMTHSGLSAVDLLKQTNGGFSLGTRFQNWAPDGRDIFHAPGELFPMMKVSACIRPSDDWRMKRIS